MNNKVAIVTGVTGQDGSFLSEFLLKKDYKVIGFVRRSSTNTHERLKDVLDTKGFMLVDGDLTDSSSIYHLVNRYKPDELYNLAAQSHVGASFKQPEITFDVNAKGVLHVLEAIRQFSPHTKFYQASTSELFGSNYSTTGGGYPGGSDVKVVEVRYQDEKTKFAPNSPYAIAKLAAHRLVGIYRKSYGLYASCGILFNHESERRGENFVTRKITQYVASLDHYRKSLKGIANTLEGKKYPTLKLGNLDSWRDWGYAPDYVEAMWMILQRKKPNDFVIATGETHSIRDFLDAAFFHIDIDNWQPFVTIDDALFRPCEVEYLCGDATKAREELGWRPKTTFKNLVGKMVDYDLENCRADCFSYS